MGWEPTASHAPLNTGGDLPHHSETRQAMGVPHPYPNSGDHDEEYPNSLITESTNLNARAEFGNQGGTGK